MKRVIVGILILVLVIFPLAGCGGGIANNPIEVVDKVKVGMTESQVKEVVDVKYFQDNKSFRALMVSQVKTTDKGFSYTISDDEDDPYYCWFLFSVESDIPAALLIFECARETVYKIGTVPFDKAKALMEQYPSPAWRLRD